MHSIFQDAIVFQDILDRKPRLTMLAACLLLIAAITGGTLLTFLFDRRAPRAARLCMGACIGLALLATLGFLLALVFGLGPATIVLSAVILLLPLLLLLHGEYLRSHSECSSLPCFVFRLGRRGHRLSGFLPRHGHPAGDGL